jgi:chromosome segregation protein
MKLAYVNLCGFRGYRKPVRIDFASGFTIIDGRNGVGKSTIFDAVEFALTGSIGKYGNAKAAGESVADYLWWIGEGPPPEDHFVEVGFCDDEKEYSIRRTQFGKPDDDALQIISDKLFDRRLAPASALAQLCTSSIIRDEHIASLSLDLKEADRYALLRDALGAIDADVWITRAQHLITLAKRRVASVQQEVLVVNSEITVAARRIDEVRASLTTEATMAGAINRLRSFANTQIAPDLLTGPVRKQLAEDAAEIEALGWLADRWGAVAAQRLRIKELALALSAAERERESAAAALKALPPVLETGPDSKLAIEARDRFALVVIGRSLGLQDGQCPLCAKGQSHAEYEQGLAAAEAIARRLDEAATREVELEKARMAAQARLDTAERALASIAAEHQITLASVAAFDLEKRKRGFSDDSTLAQLSARRLELQQLVEAAQNDLRILETLKLSGELERAQRADADAKTRLTRTQERFSRALKAESTAQALYDASRRASAETLDRRLDRMLPLMSELYRRLRPHPVWRDIEYSIRGDVQRFLKLQVGEELNPQFLFSSGQRRATGLAFLLSVNVSLAWSRWRSILLDDPVQHVDDFRTVHLAELTAQLVAEGRQIICAVEDTALADLLCRWLPIGRTGEAKRVMLGSDQDGALAKLSERQLAPLVQRSLLGSADRAAAG